MKPLQTENVAVSVIVPVYNTEKYLDQCLCSLRGQTLQEVEFICVDDGSSDRSPEILRQHAAEDARVVVISGTNQSAGAARNAGMAVAKGEYLMFLDSDDFFEPRLLELMYKRASSENLDMAVCRATTYLDSTGEMQSSPRQAPLELWLQWKGRSFCPRTEMPDKVFQLITGSPWNKIWRRAFVEQHQLRYQPIVNCNDVYFVFASFLLAERVAFVDEELVHWRVWGHSLTRGFVQHPLCFMDALQALLQELKPFAGNLRLIESFRLYCVEICAWRLSLTHYDSRLRARRIIGSVLEPLLGLEAYVERGLSSPGTEKTQRRLLKSYSQIVVPRCSFVLPVALRSSAEWWCVRRILKRVPAFANAVVLVLAIGAGMDSRLSALEEAKPSVLIVRCYDPKARNVELQRVQGFTAPSIVYPGLVSLQGFTTDALCRKAREMEPCEALGVLSMLRIIAFGLRQRAKDA